MHVQGRHQVRSPRHPASRLYFRTTARWASISAGRWYVYGRRVHIPANIEKSFDQISNAVGHVFSSGSFPLILGGDHSIGFPTVRASPRALPEDRHHPRRSARGHQEKDLDERMHTTRTFTPPTSLTSPRLTWSRSASAAGGPETRGRAYRRPTDRVHGGDRALGIPKVAEMALKEPGTAQTPCT